MTVLSTKNPENAPVFIWGQDSSHGESAELLFEEIKSRTEKDFTLASFEVTDWNSELSPWPAPAVFGKEDFPGKGQDTLSFLEKEIREKIKPAFPASRLFSAGYSLAGLFSLWTLYESELFDGAVCCSSSLWYEKWDEFAASHTIKKQAEIYMSLGNREEKTKNKVMALVGDRTRTQAEILRQDKNVKNVFFEWNEGGHFNEPLKRLAKGIAYII